jgi:hypothetical protein
MLIRSSLLAIAFVSLACSSSLARASGEKPRPNETECNYAKQGTGAAECSLDIKPEDGPITVTVRGACVIDGKTSGAQTAVLFDVEPKLDPPQLLNPDYSGNSYDSEEIVIRKSGAYYIKLSCRQSASADAVSAQIFFKKAVNSI